MAEDVTNTYTKNPRWVSLASSILAGWNVALFVAILTAIGLGVGLRNFIQISIGSASFFLVFATSVSFGILLGIVASRKLFLWYSTHTRFSGYVWFIALIIFSALSLPASFSFVTT